MPGLMVNAQTGSRSFHGMQGAASLGTSLLLTLWLRPTSSTRPAVQQQLLKLQHLGKKPSMLSSHKRISSFRWPSKRWDQSTKQATTSFPLWVAESQLSLMTHVKPPSCTNASRLHFNVLTPFPSPTPSVWTTPTLPINRDTPRYTFFIS
mgnify:FL=1